MEAASRSPVSPRLLIGVPIAAIVVLIGFVLGAAVLLGSSSASCGTSATVGDLGKGVPEELVPIYQQAAAKYKLGKRGPAMLASINYHETTFGTNMGVSSAGAVGWMQFMPETWAAYGVDGNGDGTKDPSNKWDAIFAAANYLEASGAPDDWYEAVFAYNHADWYVQEIFEDAERFEGGGGDVVVAGGGGEACAASATAPNEAVAKMIAEADRINGLELTYEYGGSHGLTPTPKDGPFDCSSAVSHLLQVAGFGNETMATPAFASWGRAGPGKWVTLHNKPFGADAHIFLEFSKGVTPANKRYWGTSGTNPGGGPGWIPESAFDAGYLSGFELRHPPGL